MNVTTDRQRKFLYTTFIAAHSTFVQHCHLIVNLFSCTLKNKAIAILEKINIINKTCNEFVLPNYKLNIVQL